MASARLSARLRFFVFRQKNSILEYNMKKTAVFATAPLALALLLLGSGISRASAPGNDNFAKKTTINNILLGYDASNFPIYAFQPITINSSNVGATKEVGEPNHAGNVGGSSIWYSWVPPSDVYGKTVTIDTFGSSFDTLLAVYTGAAVNALTTIASNDDANFSTSLTTSQVSFTVPNNPTNNPANNPTYLIAVDGYNGASGAVALHINAALNRPVNDDFANRVDLFGSQIQTISDAPPRGFTFANSTREFAELSNSAGVPDKYVYTNNSTNPPTVVTAKGPVLPEQSGGSVWFTWQAPFDGYVHISVDANSIGAYTMYEGNFIQSLEQLSPTRKAAGLASLPRAGFDIQSVVQVQRGVTYVIAIENYYPDPKMLATGYTATPTTPSTFVLSLSMYTDAPYIVLNNPRDNDVLARQKIHMSVYFNQPGNTGTVSEPIFNDPSILPFVDRVKFYAQRLLSPDSSNPAADPGPTLVGTSTTMPYSTDWLPPLDGDYTLYAVAEDDQYGFDPTTASNIVIGTQSTATLAPVNVTILGLGGNGLPLTPFTDNTTLVNELYKKILHRNPTDTELAAAVAALNGGTQTPSGLALPLLSGSAFTTAAGETIRLYRGFFRRLPTLDEFNFAVNALVNGTETYDQLAQSLTLGTEYTTLYSALSDSAFVAAVFNNVIGRAPSSQELTAWSNAIGNHQYTRLQVFERFMEAPLFGNPALYSLGSYEANASVYYTLLGRAPTAAETSQTGTPLSIIQSVLSSSSFVMTYLPNAIQYNIGGNTVYVGTFVVTVTPAGTYTSKPLDSYSTWRTNKALPPSVDPTTENFDGDTVLDLTEYALQSLGFNPKVSDGNLMPVAQIIGSAFALNYPVDVAKSDITIVPQGSTNGVNYYSIGQIGAPAGMTDVDLSTGSGTIQNRRVSIPTSTGPNLFLKLQITLKPQKS